MLDPYRNPLGSLSMGRLSSMSEPTGPGSRGGSWHVSEYRRSYYRLWRQRHPEYRDRERLRRARSRAVAAGRDPSLVTLAPRVQLGTTGVLCACGCGCQNELAVVLCGMCYGGSHA